MISNRDSFENGACFFRRSFNFETWTQCCVTLSISCLEIFWKSNATNQYSECYPTVLQKPIALAEMERIRFGLWLFEFVLVQDLFQNSSTNGKIIDGNSRFRLVRVSSGSNWVKRAGQWHGETQLWVNRIAKVGSPQNNTKKENLDWSMVLLNLL